KIASQLPSQLEDAGIAGRSFDPAIGAVIVLRPVAIVLAVGLVVLALVADQVGEGEAVMNRHMIDARARRAPVAPEQIGGAGHSAAEFADAIAFAGPVTSQRSAKLVVPFRPARRKGAHLVASGTHIPGLGNQLDARQSGVLSDRGEEG